LVARDRFWGLTEDDLQGDRKRSAAAAAAAPAAAEREAMTRSLVDDIALGRWERGAPEAPSECGGGTGWIWRTAKARETLGFLSRSSPVPAQKNIRNDTPIFVRQNLGCTSLKKMRLNLQAIGTLNYDLIKLQKPPLLKLLQIAENLH
jgi:hypothetical protein